MGRSLEKYEVMDLSKIVGMDSLVSVGNREHGGDGGGGEVYSTVQSVRRYEPEALSSSLNVSDTQSLNDSISIPPFSITQILSPSMSQALRFPQPFRFPQVHRTLFPLCLKNLLSPRIEILQKISWSRLKCLLRMLQGRVSNRMGRHRAGPHHTAVPLLG